MDVFDLAARITLDKTMFERGLREAQSDVNKSSGLISKGLGKIGNAAKTLGKIGVASFGVASAAVVSLTKKVVSAYANYEQLVGGVETLFGAQGMTLQEYADSVGQTVDEAESKYNALIQSQDTVMENARKAFKTAGVSVNEYMEQATSSAAAMVNSLNGDTVKAAELTDMAIRDMADNANKMGTNMESIQNAYSGFAKSNYTMLDNLKLGFGGTKEEMQRLLDKAEEISGVHFDISSYADITQAIHVVQEQMGITGTTAKEAEKTISGSIGMTKSAWENLIVAIGDGNNDISDEVQDLASSATNVVNNLIPVIQNALVGIAEFVQQVAPIIAEKLPGLVVEVLPQILSAAATLIGGLVQALPGMLDAVVQVAGSVVDSISVFLNEKAPILGEAFDSLVLLGKNAFDALGDAWEGEGGLKEKWGQISGWLSETLGPLVSTAWDGIKTAVGSVFQGLKDLWDGAGGLKGVWEKIQNYINDPLKKNFEARFQAIKDIITGAFQAVKDMWEEHLQPALSDLWGIIQDNLVPIVKDLSDKFMTLKTEAMQKVAWFVNGPLKAAWDVLGTILNQVVIPVVKLLFGWLKMVYDEVLVKIYDFMHDKFNKIWEAFTDWWEDTGKEKVEQLKEAFKTFNENVLQPLMGKLGEFKGVLQGLWNNYLKPVAAWVTDTFATAFEGVQIIFENLIDFLTGVFTTDWEAAWHGLTGVVKEVWEGFVDIIKGVINEVIGFVNTVIGAVETAVNFIIGGLNQIHISIPDWVPGIGGFGFGISIDKVHFDGIDYLAKGGKLLRGDAIVGEAGPELLHSSGGATTVIPLSDRMRELGDGVGGQTFNFNIYPSPAQTPLEIAQEVQRIFVDWERQKEAAYV